MQPVYLKLRITVDEDVWTEENGKKLDRHGQLTLGTTLDYLKEKGYIHSRATSGYEKKGKTGDYVRPHFHIHFDTLTKKDTIRKALVNKWKRDRDEKLSGNKMWSLQLEPYVVEDKFFCYPLKQQREDKPPPSVGFSEDDIRAMTKAAVMTAAVATDVAVKKQARREESETLYDRLEAALDKKEGTVGDILTFYMEENKPINDTTIVGYYNLYRLKRQRITIDEYSSILKSRYNI